MLSENNQVIMVGQVVSELQLAYQFTGEKFYKFFISTNRLSGVIDTLPVIISDRVKNISLITPGSIVHIEGEYRSRNNEGKLELYVYVMNISLCKDNDENYIHLIGYLCKKPIYRLTPNDREITDLLIAVHRPNGKSDYIPCISWGRNARYTGDLNIGNCLAIFGRIQSREYQKNINGEIYNATAYEVSVKTVVLYC